MSGKEIYPRSNKECECLLVSLGFKEVRGIGNAKHPKKYKHKKRRCKCPNEKPFFLITHNYFDELGKKMMKKLLCWDFTKEELIKACREVR